MKCFYELLEIDPEATFDEIKYSYRRLALKWHPDKNDSDEAKTQFQEIQKAFSILKDPQEREFYDRNRDSLLQEDAGDDSIEITGVIFANFSKSCFQGYDDSKIGFFTIYRNVFDTIGKKETQYMKEFRKIPSFGRSNTDPEEIANFYRHWLNYSTEMHFAWADTHRIDASNGRRVERFMVRENKKLRDVARKKFVEYVRSFVQLVKKRDIRMTAYLKEKQEEIERKKKQTLIKQEESRIRRIKKKQELYKKTIEEAKPDLLYEKKLRQLERQFENGFILTSSDSNNSDNNDEPETDLFCSVCNKIFRSTNSFVNHEKSKKHIENLKLLLEEDEATLLKSSGKCEETKTASDKLKLSDSQIYEISHSDEKLSDEELDHTMTKSKKRKQKKKVIKSSVFLDVDEDHDLAGDIDFSKRNIKMEDCKLSENIKIKKSRRSNKKNAKVMEIEKNICYVCAKEFPSKNKLFKHVKAEGHAVLN